jgi:hypothetical protein
MRSFDLTRYYYYYYYYCIIVLLLLLLLLLLLYLRCAVSIIGLVAVDSAHKYFFYLFLANLQSTLQ